MAEEGLEPSIPPLNDYQKFFLDIVFAHCLEGLDKGDYTYPEEVFLEGYDEVSKQKIQKHAAAILSGEEEVEPDLSDLAPEEIMEAGYLPFRATYPKAPAQGVETEQTEVAGETKAQTIDDIIQTELRTAPESERDQNPFSKLPQDDQHSVLVKYTSDEDKLAFITAPLRAQVFACAYFLEQDLTQEDKDLKYLLTQDHKTIEEELQKTYGKFYLPVMKETKKSSIKELQNKTVPDIIEKSGENAINYNEVNEIFDRTCSKILPPTVREEIKSINKRFLFDPEKHVSVKGTFNVPRPLAQKVGNLSLGGQRIGSEWVEGVSFKGKATFEAPTEPKPITTKEEKTGTAETGMETQDMQLGDDTQREKERLKQAQEQKKALEEDAKKQADDANKRLQLQEQAQEQKAQISPGAVSRLGDVTLATEVPAVFTGVEIAKKIVGPVAGVGGAILFSAVGYYSML